MNTLPDDMDRIKGKAVEAPGPMVALRDLIEVGGHTREHFNYRLSPRPNGWHAEMDGRDGHASSDGPGLYGALHWLMRRIDRDLEIDIVTVKTVSDKLRTFNCPLCGDECRIEQRMMPSASAPNGLRSYHRVTVCSSGHFAGFAPEDGKTVAIFAGHDFRRCDLCEAWNDEPEDECRACGGDTRGVVRYEPESEPDDER